MTNCHKTVLISDNLVLCFLQHNRQIQAHNSWMSDSIFFPAREFPASKASYNTKLLLVYILVLHSSGVLYCPFNFGYLLIHLCVNIRTYVFTTCTFIHYVFFNNIYIYFFFFISMHLLCINRSKCHHSQGNSRALLRPKAFGILQHNLHH